MWSNDQGEFVRYTSTFRNWVRKDGSTPFTPEAGRYHLYISWACPWAHRTVLMRSLKGLERAIGLSVVDPVWDEQGWRFTNDAGCIPDTVNGKEHLVDIYRLADPGFSGEESTPVLWDRGNRTIVNNESLEIMRMMDLEFEEVTESPPGKRMSLYPEPLRARIDETIAALYPKVNNGVYRAGFAESQRAHEKACRDVFQGLDHWEEVLSRSEYLCGPELTEADLCLFTTLIRFDLVYYSHFKCNLKRIRDYPALHRYTSRIYRLPGIAETCNFDHMKRHYYVSQRAINPTGIFPLGPEIDFSVS